MKTASKAVAAAKTASPVKKEYDFYRGGIIDIGRKIRLQSSIDELRAKFDELTIPKEGEPDAVICVRTTKGNVEISDAALVCEIVDFASSVLLAQSETIKDEIVKAIKGLN